MLLFAAGQLFFSAPGQTFLIGIFVDPIFDELGASRSLFAGVYSAATLLASTLLNPIGKLIDRYKAKTIVTGNCVGMAIACALLASAQNLYMLFIGFFMIRLVGQGVFGLTASTLLVKNFNRNRGKALSFMSLGFPTAEMIYPTIALTLIAFAGWRTSYFIFAGSFIALMLPLQLWLISKSPIVPNQFFEGEQDDPNDKNNIKRTNSENWTVKQALMDVRFYLVALPASLGPIVMTALFYHQSTIFSSNGWPITLVASAMIGYAALKIFNSLCVGPFIDKYGALPPFILCNFVLALACFFVGQGGGNHMIYVYLSLCGISLGMGIPISNVIWPSFYGVKNMGSIKGFFAMMRNALTALGPLPIAIALDLGISIQTSFKFIALTTAIIALFPLIAWRIKPSAPLSA